MFNSVQNYYFFIVCKSHGAVHRLLIFNMVLILHWEEEGNTKRVQFTVGADMTGTLTYSAQTAPVSGASLIFMAAEVYGRK